MARSSGGGSRSGGSRSRSSSSSSRSSGSSRHISTISRLGHHRYIYYDRNNNENKPRWFMLVFYIPFLFAVISIFSTSVWIPKKIDTVASPIVIEDGLHIIQDEDYLRHELEKFQEETGVTPAIITVDQAEFVGKYDTMFNYCLRQYYNHFEDETHWLIVYSEPVGSEYMDWSWEGVIGDDTGASINLGMEECLINEFHNNLYRDWPFERKIADAFNKSLEFRKIDISGKEIAVGIGVLIFIIFHGGVMIFAGTSKKHTNVKLASSNDTAKSYTYDTNNYDTQLDDRLYERPDDHWSSY